MMRLVNNMHYALQYNRKYHRTSLIFTTGNQHMIH